MLLPEEEEEKSKIIGNICAGLHSNNEGFRNSKL
jgi:hypothetical protein